MRILPPGRRPRRLRTLALGSAILAGLAVGGGALAVVAGEDQSEEIFDSATSDETSSTDGFGFEVSNDDSGD